MGDNLKQHNPNFIVLQSGMGAWLRVIGSNLCTSAQSLFEQEKGSLQNYTFQHFSESSKSLPEMAPTS